MSDFSGFKKITKNHVNTLDATMIGRKLGAGATRVVYEWKPDPSYVLKVEIDPDFAEHNSMEWMIWTGFRELPAMRKYFAPCKWISPDGHYLLMRRCKPHDAFPEKTRPSEFPFWLGDTCDFNFGWLKDEEKDEYTFVCIDYAGQTMGEIIDSFGKKGRKTRHLSFAPYGISAYHRDSWDNDEISD